MPRPRRIGGGVDGTSVKMSDPRIPICTICGLGIFNVEERVWNRGQYMGLIHNWHLSAATEEAA